MKLQIVAAVTSLVSLVAASTLNPPVLPLIVRNPYLSTWLGNARDKPWTKWPMFYTGEEVCSERPVPVLITSDSPCRSASPF